MRNLILCFMTTKRPPCSYVHHRPSEPPSINSLFSAASSEPEPDFAAVFASKRLFFSSPGCSSSIIESSPSMSPTASSPDYHRPPPKPLPAASVADSLAVETYSVDPYADFRRSMEKMVEARGLHDVKASWDYLHELLLCYLVLNPKNTHEFITGAFTDLLFTLISSSTSTVSHDLLLD